MNTNIGQLRALWKNAFGDSDAFLDMFFDNAYHPSRCHYIKMDDKIVSALYWFDCMYLEHKLAYIYAVATDSNYRGQGLCHTLMNETHQHLKSMGYAGALLVPGSQSLFQFYANMGYEIATYVDEFAYDLTASASSDTLQAAAYISDDSDMSLAIRKVSIKEYEVLRRRFLPEQGVLQEGENLDFLAAQAEIYAGEDFLLACQKDGDVLHVLELLGNHSIAPSILHSLQCKKGSFRTPGTEKPFAMCYKLEESLILPEYFGLAFD